jgi:hypothetical protein
MHTFIWRLKQLTLLPRSPVRTAGNQRVVVRANRSHRHTPAIVQPHASQTYSSNSWADGTSIVLTRHGCWNYPIPKARQFDSHYRHFMYNMIQELIAPQFWRGVMHTKHALYNFDRVSNGDRMTWCITSLFRWRHTVLEKSRHWQYRLPRDGQSRWVNELWDGWHDRYIRLLWSTTATSGPLNREVFRRIWNEACNTGIDT